MTGRRPAVRGKVARREARSLVVLGALALAWLAAPAWGTTSGQSCPVPPTGGNNAKEKPMISDRVSPMSRAVPPIDAARPSVTEVAVFGLG
jgi:hypothetical protein